MDKNTMTRSISLSNRNLLMSARATDNDELTSYATSSDNQFDDEDDAQTSRRVKKRQQHRPHESYQFAGIQLNKSAAAGAPPGGNVKLPSAAQLPLEVKNPNCAETTASADKIEDANTPSRQPRLADVVNTLNGRQISESLRQSPVIQSALRQRDVASSPSKKDTSDSAKSVSSSEGRGTGSGRKLNMDLFGPVTQQRLSSSQMLKGCLVNKTTIVDDGVQSLPGYASSSSPITSPSSAEGETGLTGMAKWKYPTHKSFIVDMNNPPNYDAAKSVSFEVRERRPLPGDTASTSSTLDIAEAVGPAHDDVTKPAGATQKDAHCTNKAADTSSVYYPTSSPFHPRGGDQEKKSVYDRVGPVGLVTAAAFCLLILVLVCVVVSSTNAIRNDVEEVKAMLTSMKCQGCLVKDVATDTIE